MKFSVKTKTWTCIFASTQFSKKNDKIDFLTNLEYNDFMLRSSFLISSIKEDRIVIIDNNSGNRSVTNDAENVVRYLYNIYGDRRFFYVDSDGVLGELRHEKGNFVGFSV